MKQYFFLICISITYFQSCNTEKQIREKASDGIIHLEDTIYSTIPDLPRLCDAMELEKRYIEIEGTKLYVEIEGKGTPVVLINGGPGGTHHYFHPWFSKLKKKHTIIYYDQRGTGLSGFNPGAGYTFKQATKDLDALRKALGFSKWIVFGYSYGGGLAQYYTLRYPENTLGLILNSAHPVFKSDYFKSEQQKFISQKEKDQFDVVTQKAIQDRKNGKLSMAAFLYNMAANGDWKRQNYYKPTKEEMIRSALYEWVNDRGFNSIMSKNLSQYNFKGAFNNCPIPTLIFEGKHDLTWGPDKAKIFKANHPNASFVFFEQSGHQIFKDEPKKFINEVLKFTKKLKPISQESIKTWKNNMMNNIEPEN
ncbi:alpha/beta fold hydrolase [Flavobacteriaceae bacterium R38]|nr:alpha/beta fold hydrolase [Flavobacteriaceae bacterium R38]